MGLSRKRLPESSPSDLFQHRINLAQMTLDLLRRQESTVKTVTRQSDDIRLSFRRLSFRRHGVAGRSA